MCSVFVSLTLICRLFHYNVNSIDESYSMNVSDCKNHYETTTIQMDIAIKLYADALHTFSLFFYFALCVAAIVLIER